MVDSAPTLARHNALLTWLRYDPERVPTVEAAYDEFIRSSRYGVAIFAAFVIALIAVGIASWFQPRALGHIGPIALIAGNFAFYGIQLFSLRAVPKETIATVLSGAVDWRRAVIFGAALGLVILFAESAVVAVLASLHIAGSDDGPDPFAMGIVVGTLAAAVLAPIAEEFMMQGWLQTRLRGLGPKNAAAATTCMFLVLHAPTSPFALVRVLLLSGVATVRQTIRSLGAAIAMHVVNNLVACLLAIFAPAFLHLK